MFNTNRKLIFFEKVYPFPPEASWWRFCFQQSLPNLVYIQLPNPFYSREFFGKPMELLALLDILTYNERRFKKNFTELSLIYFLYLKIFVLNPSYGRQQLSRHVRIIALCQKTKQNIWILFF